MHHAARPPSIKHQHSAAVKRNSIAVAASPLRRSASQSFANGRSTLASLETSEALRDRLGDRRSATDGQHWEDPVESFHHDQATNNKHINERTGKQDGKMAEEWPPDFQQLATSQKYGEMIESKYVEALCLRLRMSNRDVWRLRKQFNDIDVDTTNTITLEEFFFLIHEEKRGLSKTLLHLANASPSQTRLSFDEYLCCVCEFASYSEAELLRFVFSVYKTDKKRGVMLEDDVMSLAHALMTQGVSYKRNILQAAHQATSGSRRGRGSLYGSDLGISLEELERLARTNRVAFYPLLKLQCNVRKNTLGERYWQNKVCENGLIDAMVQYMHRHGGEGPPLSWKERFWSAVCWPRETKAIQLRRYARARYAGERRR